MTYHKGGLVEDRRPGCCQALEVVIAGPLTVDCCAARRAQDATADGWRILEDYRIFLTSRSQEATAATEAVRNRWRNEARLHPAP